MATLKMEITTPGGIEYSGEVEHVRAPGIMGSFGILEGHTPFITPIDIGEIQVRTKEGNKVFATSGGLADVRGNMFLILAETAEEVSKIDLERALSAKERAEKRLAKGGKELDVERARAALARATNRIRIGKS